MNAAPFRRRTDLPAEWLQPVELKSLLRMACWDWSAIAVCWLLMAWGPRALWPLEMLLIASRLQALGVLLHDACHRPREAPSAAQTWLEMLAGYSIASTLAAMRYHHLRHHRHNGTALDPYFKPGASHRRGPAVAGRLRGLLLPPAWILRAYVGCVALAWPPLRNAYGRVFLGDRSGDDLQQHREIRRCLRAEPAQALFFAAVALLAWRWPLAVSVGYLLPLLGAGLLNAHRVIAEHVHVPAASRQAAALLATTRTHASRARWSRLLYPRHIGLHAAHHLHPTVALQHLPAVHAWYCEHEALYRRTQG
jgi:fatty acid desaturase